ncbi:hypothetical protein Ahy_A07g032362 [Arachis hypogaea]|uniref:Uncharacterized protein n=1 Tax=Arachis hypogaea TaxID=3818 RepID=A0A445C6N8_ARAHY|nr:hypothetical protein Ahy_A07g032362 [Arachis hypogaea]
MLLLLGLCRTTGTHVHISAAIRVSVNATVRICVAPAVRVPLLMLFAFIVSGVLQRNDTIGKVFGEEHSGKMQCMGMGATPTNTFRNANHHPSQLANSSTSMFSTNYSHADFKCLESKFDGTLTALKTYFLFKEGIIPVELTIIFDHGAQANDVENETITPTIGRISSGRSNEIVKTLFRAILKND